MPVQVTCAYEDCAKPILVKPSRIKRSEKFFCGLECKKSRTKKIRKCSNCDNIRAHDSQQCQECWNWRYPLGISAEEADLQRIQLIKESSSKREFMRRGGFTFPLATRIIEHLNTDISHFHKMDLEDLFRDSTNDDVLIQNNSSVRRKILEFNLIPYMCENGHPPEWLGEPLRLHLDHINGNRRDNRLENLRFLCPNCHDQTETWGSQNKTNLKEIKNK